MNPYGAEFLLILEGQGDREKEFHELFKDKHHTGEWFLLSDCEVVSIGDVE